MKKRYFELEKKFKKYIKKNDELKLIKKVYEFSEKKHENVLREDNNFLIDHLLNIVEILTDLESDYVSICGALLHENDLGKDEIEALTNKKIAKVVEEVKKINKLNLSIKSDYIINYYKKIIVGLCEDPRVIIIKLADRLDNMRNLDAYDDKTKKRKALETNEIFVSIASHLGIHYLKSQLEDLSLKYSKPDVYKDIEEKLNNTKNERDQYISVMISKISKILNDNRIKFEIKGRSKSIHSIYSKLLKGRSFDDIYDILALRIYVNSKNDCYLALGLIHSNFKSIPKRFKDYISRPKKNMYQSLHTTVFGEHDLLYEIQIRTYEMDKIAEQGFAAHWAYKEKKDINSKDVMEQKLQIFRNILESNKENNLTDTEFLETIKTEIQNDEIYIYTPKGDVIQLPKKSTPIDFAYKVHTEVGDKMTGAFVNDMIVPLDYELKDSDIVKIITNKNSKGPSKEWMNIAKTTQAKTRIKSFYTKIDKEENIEKGKILIEKELRKRKIPFSDFNVEKNIELLLKETKDENMDDLYLFVATNKYSPSYIVNLIYKEEKSKEEIVLEKMNVTINKSDLKKDIIVSNISEIKVNLASCCMPIKNDEIIGYITKENGVSVHRKECLNITTNKDRIIDVKWNNTSKNKFATNLIIKTNKKDNFLIKLISKASSSNINIKNINTKNNKDDITYKIQVLVENKEVLDKFINETFQIKDVLLVERMIK